MNELVKKIYSAYIGELSGPDRLGLWSQVSKDYDDDMLCFYVANYSRFLSSQAEIIYKDFSNFLEELKR